MVAGSCDVGTANAQEAILHAKRVKRIRVTMDVP
jgi:hypothetical protein